MQSPLMAPIPLAGSLHEVSTSRSPHGIVQNAICSVCDGTGKQGLLGRRGMGLFTRECTACQGQRLLDDGNEEESEEDDQTEDEGAEGALLYLPADFANPCTNVQIARANPCTDVQVAQCHGLGTESCLAPRILTSTDSDDLGHLSSRCDLEPVMLNVYFIRSVGFDEQGRVVRTGKSKLTWTRKLVKDILGIYHVGLQVHGYEYVFGNYHALESRRLGDEGSGVCAHQPKRAGPRYQFKDSINLGGTSWSAAQVEQAASQLGQTDFRANSYNRIRHNCVDFARSLAETMGADELPSWCQRAASVAKRVGAGVDSVTAAAAHAATLRHAIPNCGAPDLAEPEELI